MIGAMPAVAVRHERRKNKTKDKSNRPSRLLLKPYNVQQGDGQSSGGAMSPMGSHAHSQAASRAGSRAGSPTHTAQNGSGVTTAADTIYVRYGDECFYNKLSLLHFIIFFLLGGLTVLVVGAVQFKREAGLSYLRYHFLVAGAVLVLVGIVLLVIKCACFRTPLPDDDDYEEDLEHKSSGSKLASPITTTHPHLTITPAKSRTPQKSDGSPEENLSLTNSENRRRKSSTLSQTSLKNSEVNKAPPDLKKAALAPV